jgi:Uma2 family endonuclease
MRTETTKKLFTVDEYYRMGEAGILGPEDRVELINGEILKMSPIGNPHVACVDRANALFAVSFTGKAIVSIQNPVLLNTYNEPQPDVVLMKARPDFYKLKRHMPEDVLLLIEVADTTLRFDRKVKLPIYAASGVTEVWIEDLQHDKILVFRDPKDDVYKTCLTFQRGDSISIAAMPDTIFKVEDLLG